MRKKKTRSKHIVHSVFAEKRARPFSQHSFAKKTEFITPLPKIFLTRDAYNKMYHLVDLSDKEISWLGTVVEMDNKDFLIKEIFLFKQEVSHTTTEISAEGLAEVATEIMNARPDGVDVVNSLRFWGHSHVNMGTSPSPQDDSQMSLFEENGCEFFIRGILNKNGRMKFTIYLYDRGIRIADAEWAIHEKVDDTLRSEIEKEIKEKVSEARYPLFSQYTYTGNHYRPYESLQKGDNNDHKSY